MTGWRAAVLVAAVLAVLAGSARGACPGNETHFRLYRSSAATQGAAIHVATFDATLQAEGGGAAEYNRGNCEIRPEPVPKPAGCDRDLLVRALACRPMTRT